MENPNPIYYRDLITPDDSITKLISQLDDLIQTYDGAKNKIQGAASEISKGLQGVAGASEEQRKAIQLATEQSDKLVQEYRDITSAQWKATQAFAEATAAKKESLQIDKLVTQINTSAEGSYNRLSAQYRLNKIRLNEMSAAERQGTEAGRELERETNAIYEEMKRLQEATGKHQLNVGNYADAAKGLKQELMSLTQQMTYLKVNGEQGSEEYQQMAQRAGQLKDAMADAQSEVKNLASDTANLDATMGAASAASGGMAAVNGSMALMGQASETASDAQKNLGAAVGIVSGLTAVQNALQKESNVMTGIRTLQTKAATKAEQMDTAAKAKNATVTVAATVAQKAFNIVAKANPYVLLAIALITVIGALVAFSAGANKAAKEQKKMNEQLAAELDYLEQIAKEHERVNNQRISDLEDELKIAQAEKKSKKEIQALEDEIYNERVKAHDQRMKDYADQVKGEEVNRAKLEQLQKTLLELRTAQAQGKNKIKVDVDMDGKVENTKIDKAIEAVQGQIDNYGRAVQIAVELKEEGKDIQTERAIQLAQRKTAGGDRRKVELDAIRAAEDARLELIADAYKRERQQITINANRQIEDLEMRLKKEKSLTKKAREAIEDEQKSIKAKALRDLEDLQNEYFAVNLAAQRETEDLRIALMAEGAEKEREALRVAYQRRIEDITTAIATERDLTAKEVEELYNQQILIGEEYQKKLAELNAEISIEQMQREADGMQLRLDAMKEGSQEAIDITIELLRKRKEIEISENAKLSDEMKQSEADIIAKWDAEILKQAASLTEKRAKMLLESQQDLAASEFALLDRNERQKTDFQLQQERERLQALLDLDKTAGVKMSEQERKTIENTIKAIDKERKKTPYNNLYEVLGIGLDSDQQSALNTAIDSVKESISGIIDAWNAAADAALNAANAQVDAAQKTLDAEIEARNAGYANEVQTAQKELALAKENQDKALKEKESAQRAQTAIDTITQASSLITASANIWSSLSGVPVVGPALAVAALATMWGSFAFAKVKALQVTQQTQQYGEGTVELLQGGSHASGHDIDMGVTKDGKRRRAEGGEFFAIINKRNSRKYRTVIPDVINSFNNGTFADRYQRASAAMAGYAVAMGSTDVSGLERDVAAIRKQGDKTEYIDAQGNTVIKYKNLTRKIKS